VIVRRKPNNYTKREKGENYFEAREERGEKVVKCCLKWKNQISNL
jgi:hypothetical protein